jgi:hypothetical protein
LPFETAMPVSVGDVPAAFVPDRRSPGKTIIRIIEGG